MFLAFQWLVSVAASHNTGAVRGRRHNGSVSIDHALVVVVARAQSSLTIKGTCPGKKFGLTSVTSYQTCEVTLR